MPQGDAVLINLTCDHGLLMTSSLLFHTVFLYFSLAEKKNPHFHNKTIIEESSTILTLESI